METNNIEQLIEYLPLGYEEKCHETGAIERKRVIKDALSLMRLCLLYLTQACSLLDVSLYASLLSIGKLSDVAFMKRFAKCGKWFEWIIRKIRPQSLINYQKPEGLEAYTLVGLDASDVTEKGATKRVWRLHYALDILNMRSLQQKITDQKTGESLTNFEIKPEYLILGDRAYGTKTSIEYCLENEGNFVFRMKNKAFKLYNKDKQEIHLLDALKKATEEDATDVEVYIKNAKKEFVRLRVCAIKKTPEQIERSRRHINKNDVRKGQTTSEETKQVNDYIVVITSVSETISAIEILSLYRLRWQVELYFKRLKSIMDFGDIPKKKEEGVKAWLHGKIMVALLLEKVMGAGAAFSPCTQK